VLKEVLAQLAAERPTCLAFTLQKKELRRWFGWLLREEQLATTVLVAGLYEEVGSLAAADTPWTPLLEAWQPLSPS
jgi:hypothetical protein